MLLAASTHGYWNLETLWFFLIVVLWIGYFVLEGFDFGVGMLEPLVGGNVEERGRVIRTIGPVWDGNEVWLLVAGGATFAAFPAWYASLFSGFYLALFLLLVGLIVRGVAIEYRNKRPDAVWRTRWDWTLAISSAVPALLWGVAFANIVHGVPTDAHGQVTASLLDLLGPYALFGGVTSLVLVAFHASLFLSLRLTDELELRARGIANRLAGPAALLVLGFLIWTYVNAASAHNKGLVPGVIPVAAICLPFAAGALARAGKEGWAFGATCATIALVTLTLFLNLYPRVIVSSVDNAFSPTIFTTSSSHYTLTVMSVVALLFTPVVLLYQGWTYWVFRARVSGTSISPAEYLASTPIGKQTS
jgi:cytochrome bd ubiquinol oxidase subunit II